MTAAQFAYAVLVWLLGAGVILVGSLMLHGLVPAVPALDYGGALVAWAGVALIVWLFRERTS